MSPAAKFEIYRFRGPELWSRCEMKSGLVVVLIGWNWHRKPSSAAYTGSKSSVLVPSLAGGFQFH